MTSNLLTQSTEIPEHHHGDSSIQNVGLGVVGYDSLDLICQVCEEES